MDLCRSLNHARRLKKTLMLSTSDERKESVLQLLKIIKKGNDFQMKKDKEAQEIRQLETSKDKNHNFYKYKASIQKNISAWSYSGPRRQTLHHQGRNG